MKAKLLILSAIFLFKCLLATGQGRRDLTELINQTPNSETNTCAFIKTETFTYPWREGDITIYGARSNAEISVFSKKERGQLERYYFEPLVYIHKLEQKGNRVQITLKTKAPPALEIHEYLHNDQEKFFLPESQVTPLCVQGISLEDFLRGASYSEAFTGGSTVDNSIAMLVYPDEEIAKEAVSAILSGEGLSFYVAYNQTDIQALGIGISRKSFLESRAYRDMVSPILQSGKLISVDKEAEIVSAIRHELDLYEYRSAEANKHLDEHFENLLLNLMGLQSNERLITWDQLVTQGGAARNLENLNSLRYKADEMRSLYHDASSLSDDQWCQKYNFSSNSKEHNIRKRDISGKGSADVVKIIKGSSSFSYSRHTNELNQESSNEESQDCGRSILQQNDDLKWEGHIVTAKGIIAKELTEESISVESYERVRVALLTNGIQAGKSTIIHFENR